MDRSWLGDPRDTCTMPVVLALLQVGADNTFPNPPEAWLVPPTHPTSLL